MDSAELEVLGPDECQRLLRSQHVGRIGVVLGGYPVILPVNYGVYEGRLVVRTDAGRKFQAAREHRVSFEVDHFDDGSRRGWSVLVEGFATEVTPDDHRYEDLERHSVQPWAPGDRSNVLLITPVSVTGRRINRSGED